jgi:uncharacterized protein involved in exopolysaccharide biosynthesis
MAENKDPFNYLFKIDPAQYFRILIEQKIFILVFCLSAVLSSLGLTYVFSEKYIAATTIYYRPVDTSLMHLKDKQVFGAPAPDPPFKVILQTLGDIIRSDVILRPVVEKLELDKSIKAVSEVWYKRWFHTAKDKVKEYALKLWTLLKYGRLIEEEATVAAITRLRKNINIQSAKDSYVYLLTWLKDQDLDPAEVKLNQFQAELDEKEALLAKLRDNRETLLKRSSLVSVSDETDKGIKSLYELEKEYVNLGAEIEGKRKKIAGLEMELEQKTTGYTNPDDLKKMRSEKLFEEIELKELQAQAVSLESSIAVMKTKLQQMLDTKKKVEDIEMKIEANAREYLHLKDLYLESLSQTKTGESEVKVMHAAEIPSKPAQQIKIYPVGLNFFLSLFFEAGLVYVFAFFNIRIFFASDGEHGRHESAEQKRENN